MKRLKMFPLPEGSLDPLPFKKVLRLLVPDRRRISEREILLREFRKHELALAQQHRAISPDDRHEYSPLPDIAEEMKRLKAGGVSWRTLSVWDQTFPEWRAAYHQANRSKANRENVINGRWKKKTLAAKKSSKSALRIR